MPSRKQVPFHPLLLDLEAYWLLSLEAEGKSSATLETYRNGLERFCAWLSDDGKTEHCRVTVDQVTEEMCQEFMVWLRRTWSLGTASTRHKALKSFFAWALSREEIPASPMARVKRPIPPVDTVPILTDLEVQALLATCGRGKSFLERRDYAILRTFLATGMRRAELCSLEVADVDLKHGIIHIKHGKGGDGRFAAIGPKCKDAIGSYLLVRQRRKQHAASALWLSQSGPLALKTLDWLIGKRGRQAGLPGHVHAHLFRHHFSDKYLEAGGDVINLTRLAGWSNVSMAARYAKANEQQRAVAEHHRLGIGEEW